MVYYWLSRGYKEVIIGIIMRTLYNNQGWQSPCISPYKDRECGLCFQPNVHISPPSVTDEVCAGICWEKNLCVKYRWGCTPQGRTFGGRAHIGVKVFFVYKQLDRNYTLWGKTTVQSMDDRVLEEGEDDEKGFAFIHFDPFQALPKDKWVRNLAAQQLVGKKWLMGRYRYIDTGRESYLEQLIEGGKAEKRSEGPLVTPPPNTITLNVRITPNIDDELGKIAYKEGRQKDEIIREAIAEWLKNREL